MNTVFINSWGKLSEKFCSKFMGEWFGASSLCDRLIYCLIYLFSNEKCNNFMGHENPSIAEWNRYKADLLDKKYSYETISLIPFSFTLLLASCECSNQNTCARFTLHIIYFEWVLTINQRRSLACWLMSRYCYKAQLVLQSDKIIFDSAA